MTIEQFNKVVELGKKIGGQKLSIQAATPQDKNILKEYRGRGIRKYSYSAGTVRVMDTQTMVNTSTGVVAMGVELKPLRESHYESVAHDGLCSQLKSNPDKKYILIKFSEIDDKESNKHQPYYMDAEGNIYNPATILTPKKEPGTVRGQIYAASGVDYRPYGIENITRLRVAGLDLIDDSLIQYSDVLGIVFEKAL